jgi:glycosyltransferase involved in cell wall biosynthesis
MASELENHDSSLPLIAVCMTTHDPRLDLLEAQIDSLLRQTYTRWVCIVSDDCSHPSIADELPRLTAADPRFSLSSAPVRLGFYRNFERALGMIPSAAAFVALCDQDDVWHPDKLESLMSQMEDEGITLAYSDMRVVTAEGRLMSDTYWTTRPTASHDLASLVLVNTIPGPTVLFRASLLPFALPFPALSGDAYHDHWLACCALACGEIAYIARPLVDYVHHGENVLGHVEPSPDRLARQALDTTRAFVSREARTKTVGRLHEIYRDDVRRVQLIARTIRNRGGSALPRGKAEAVDRIARIDNSWFVIGWLLVRGLRNIPRLSETVGAEYALAAAAAWHRITRA